MNGYVILFILILAFPFVMVVVTSIYQKNKAIEKDQHDKEFVQWLAGQGLTPTSAYVYRRSIGEMFDFMVDSKKQILFWSKNREKALSKIPFKMLTGAEIFEDGHSTDGVGRAIKGGFLLGDVGAIVGAQTANQYINSMIVRFYIDSVDKPYMDLILLGVRTSKSSSQYREATKFGRQILAVVKAITH